MATPQEIISTLNRLITRLETEFRDEKILQAVDTETQRFLRVDLANTGVWNEWEEELDQLTREYPTRPLSIKNIEYRKKLSGFLQKLIRRIAEGGVLAEKLVSNMPSDLEGKVKAFETHLDEVRREQAKWEEFWRNYRENLLKQQRLEALHRAVEYQAASQAPMGPGDLVILARTTSDAVTQNNKQPPDRRKTTQALSEDIVKQLNRRARGLAQLGLAAGTSDRFREFVQKVQDYEVNAGLIAPVYAAEPPQALVSQTLTQLQTVAPTSERTAIDRLLTQYKQEEATFNTTGEINPTFATLTGSIMFEQGVHRQLVTEFGRDIEYWISDIERMRLTGQLSPDASVRDIRNALTARYYERGGKMLSLERFVIEYEEYRGGFAAWLRVFGVVSTEATSRLFSQAHGFDPGRHLPETYARRRISTLVGRAARIPSPIPTVPAPQVSAQVALTPFIQALQRLGNRYSFLLPISRFLERLLASLQPGTRGAPLVIRGGRALFTGIGQMGGGLARAAGPALDSLSQAQTAGTAASRAAGVLRTLTGRLTFRHPAVQFIIIVAFAFLVAGFSATPLDTTTPRIASLLPPGIIAELPSPQNSRFIEVKKTVTPSRFTTNAEAKGKILTYTITISAPIEAISTIAFENTAQILTRSGSTPFSIPDVSSQIPGSLNAGETKTVSYEVTLPTDNSINDSVVTDTITIRATTPEGEQISYASAAVLIGNPPDLICNNNFAGRKYCFPIVPAYSVSPSCSHHDYVASDITTRAGFPSPTVVAFVDGTILVSNCGNAIAGCAIIEQGADGYIYGYYHLASLQVNQGNRVSAGDPLGVQGKTGNAATTAEHTHFQTIAAGLCSYSDKSICGTTYNQSCLNNGGTRGSCLQPHVDNYSCPSSMFEQIFGGAIQCGPDTSFKGCPSCYGERQNCPQQPFNPL